MSTVASVIESVLFRALGGIVWNGSFEQYKQKHPATSYSIYMNKDGLMWLPEGSPVPPEHRKIENLESHILGDLGFSRDELLDFVAELEEEIEMVLYDEIVYLTIGKMIDELHRLCLTNGKDMQRGAISY